ncbi:MAG: glutamate 5-kinase [Candidatus Marinimicrobia bacterium]|nr:glutamate 5-kinase [Candidatus Neomarinimicrobiota bacterium]
MRTKFRDFHNKRLIVKVGSHVLSEGNRFTSADVRHIADQIMELIHDGNEVLLVTSGAVLMGRNLMDLNLSLYPRNLKQSLAAIGQVALMSEYTKIFAELNRPVGQILINLEDFHDRARYLNIKQTIQGLFKLKVLPILNENDCISTEDFAFGDNDNMAAQLTGMLDADLLIILSTVDGLYDGEPKDPASRVIPTVASITPRMLKDASTKGQLLSTGGMVAKLQAIKKAVHFGVPVILANGKERDILRKIFSGDQVGTLFEPKAKRMPLRKRWLAYSTKVKGQVMVDEGARVAVTLENASLLSSGVTGIQGKFEAQDVVAILDEQGREFARGITKYDWRGLLEVAGKSHDEIVRTLGVKYFNEVVHREDLVLLPVNPAEES